jgi:hypothetical protein
MNKKQIIEMLEQRFLNYHKKMDAHAKLKHEHNAIKYATLCCEFADILANINNTTEQYELERLYKKFNLQDIIY